MEEDQISANILSSKRYSKKVYRENWRQICCDMILGDMIVTGEKDQELNLKNMNRAIFNYLGLQGCVNWMVLSQAKIM